jgi:translation initiation factor 1
VRNSRLVYSTEEGGRVPGAESPRPPARGAAPKGSGLPDDGVIRVVRDRSGRRGKVVTVVHGLPERGAALEARASELRRRCGAGGTVKDGVVEIQGDHRERVALHLRALGYTVKLAGG